MKYLRKAIEPAPLPTAAPVGSPFRAPMRDIIEKLRETLPPLLTIEQYCHTRNCCQAAAYNDFKKHPGLAVKDGRSTRVVRNIALDLIANLPLWVPERDRDPGEKVSAALAASRASNPHRGQPKRRAIAERQTRSRGGRRKHQHREAGTPADSAEATP
jgi:hypothetical protein